MLERLQKIISAAGITSRRASEALILNGQVAVNGIVVTELGSKADPAKDTITVDGKTLKISAQRLYILLNKPTGYITALKDGQGRPLVTDLLKDVPDRVYPVGRLDYNTEGLLLLTNDGEWANRLMHPRHEIEKEYHVRVRGKVIDQQLSLSVVRLKRIRYGALELGTLRTGKFRFLTDTEVRELAGDPAWNIPVEHLKREERPNNRKAPLQARTTTGKPHQSQLKPGSAPKPAHRTR